MTLRRIRSLILLLSFSAAASLVHGAPADKPNVIVVMTDDQGYGDIGAHGNPYLKTPALDRLHEEGVRFTDFHVDPTCSPTRAALMTGRYSSRVGVWLTYASRHHLRRGEVTMADVFRQNGYTTGIFGKWHLGDNYPFRPMDRGFEESLIHGGGVVGESPDYWGNDYYDDTYFRNGVPEKVNGFCTDVWFNEAMRFITEKRNEPFFLYLPTNTPHGPHHVPAQYVEPYLNNPKIPHKTARFYGTIANIDENIARLRARLITLGLADDTIFIFLTDNGGTAGVDGFNAGMRGRKATAYEGGHRAASFVHWPDGGLTGGRDIDELSAHLDLLPTLIDWCDLTPPVGVVFDGQSLAPFVRGETDAWPNRRLFVHHQGRFRQEIGEGLPIKYKAYSVLTEQWRMVGKELYAFNSDPGQQNDIASKHPQVVSDLTEAYEEWWSDISGKFDEHTPFVVDPAHQRTTKLTAQNWYGDKVPYNQQHVRAGVKANGPWVIDVAKPGEYNIELRRWPRELNLTIDEKWEHGLTDPDRFEVSDNLMKLPSTAIDGKTARLTVGGFDESKSVRPGDRAITFRVDLKPGEQRVQSWFTTSSGEQFGAYYVYIEPADGQKVTGTPKSAATERFTAEDSYNDLYTLFRYSPVKGLGYEEGVGRRDPSSIVKVGDLYYVWYTRIEGQPPDYRRVPRLPGERRFRWDLADIWYATSPDGRDWTERGPAIERGPAGSFDDRSVFTANILVAGGKYYLVYQAVKAPYGPETRNVIAMSKADSPDGPWEKLPAPILETTPGGEREKPVDSQPDDYRVESAWDSQKVHDPGILVRDRKYWLYYKGEQIGRHPFESKWGVAIADRPEGPYIKSPLNPISNSGHEIWVWPWKTGVAAMIDFAGPEKHTLQYAEDGLNFEIVAALEDIPPAGGAYVPDKFSDTRDGQGFTWGLAYTKFNQSWDFIVRFDCDLHRDSKKEWPGARWRHYGTIRDVLTDPARFGVPSR